MSCQPVLTREFLSQGKLQAVCRQFSGNAAWRTSPIKGWSHLHLPVGLHRLLQGRQQLLSLQWPSVHSMRW